MNAAFVDKTADNICIAVSRRSCVLPHKLGRWLEARETRLKLADIAQVARVVTHKDWKAEHATLGNDDKMFVAEQDVW